MTKPKPRSPVFSTRLPLSAEPPASCPAPIRACWHSLCNHLYAWHHEPDLQAAEIIISVCAVHLTNTAEPIFLFLIGPASGGKTAIYITIASCFPEARIAGDLTPRCFLPTQKDGRGLLTDLGPRGILLFKDFTTILGKREADRLEIVSQLREVFDGDYVRDTGLRRREWHGKATIVAAATYAIESHWMVHRELGERFINVALSESIEDPAAFARRARLQSGREDWIKAQTKELTQRFLDATPSMASTPPDLSDSHGTRIDYWSSAVAVLRASVQREIWGGNEITDVSPPERPGRLAKAMASVARGHALVFRLPEVSEASTQRALRIGWDSIPWRRRALLSHLLAAHRSGDPMISQADLQRMTAVPLSTLRKNLEDMEALGCVEHRENSGGIGYSLTPWLAEHTDRAFTIED